MSTENKIPSEDILAQKVWLKTNKIHLKLLMYFLFIITQY